MTWQYLSRTVCWQASGSADAGVQGPESAEGNVTKAAAAQAARPRKKFSVGTCLEAFSSAADASSEACREFWTGRNHLPGCSFRSVLDSQSRGLAHARLKVAVWLSR
jgi:hypothetical protein